MKKAIVLIAFMLMDFIIVFTTNIKAGSIEEAEDFIPASANDTWGNVNWELTPNGTLTFTSGGTFADSNSEYREDSVETTNWHEFPTSIKRVVFTQPLVAAANSTGLFLECNYLTEIEGLEYFDTKQTSNMKAMFSYCSSLETIDLSSFNTPLLKTVQAMFAHCQNLESVNLGNINTTQVTDMSGMFYNCMVLNDLDLSKLKTPHAQDMSGIFFNCNLLTNLDSTSFNTSKVGLLPMMFEGCSNLKNLDLSEFNTVNV